MATQDVQLRQKHAACDDMAVTYCAIEEEQYRVSSKWC